jgi:hypothetical protein
MQGLGFAPQPPTGLGSLVSRAKQPAKTPAKTPDRPNSPTSANGMVYANVPFRFEGQGEIDTVFRQNLLDLEQSSDVFRRLMPTALRELESRIDPSGVPLFGAMQGIVQGGSHNPFSRQAGNVIITGVSQVARGKVGDITNDIRDALRKAGLDVPNARVTLSLPNAPAPTLPNVSPPGVLERILGTTGGNTGGNPNPKPDTPPNLLNFLAQTIGVQPTTLMLVGIGAGTLVLLPAVLGAFKPVRVGRY